jgi:hypothetical protein
MKRVGVVSILLGCIIIALMIAGFALSGDVSSDITADRYKYLNNGTSVDVIGKSMFTTSLNKSTQASFNRNFILLPTMDIPIKASELIKQYPQIMIISYYDEKNKRYVTYVPIRGGIGTDFTIQPEIIYEIIANKDIAIAYQAK